jgi:hypothetical protein
LIFHSEINQRTREAYTRSFIIAISAATDLVPAGPAAA